MNQYTELTMIDGNSLATDVLKHVVETNCWYQKHFFDVHQIPLSILVKTLPDQFVSTVVKNRGTAVVLRLPPNTWYDWHTDVKRTGAINMLLEGNDSHCLFGERVSDKIVSVSQMDYKPATLVLFNTQVYHSVLNLSQPRLLFSIGFEQMSYDQMLIEFERHM
jgi:hypothetical protein